MYLKMARNLQGPFTIARVNPDGTYQLETESGKIFRDGARERDLQPLWEGGTYCRLRLCLLFDIIFNALVTSDRLSLQCGALIVEPLCFKASFRGLNIDHTHYLPTYLPTQVLHSLSEEKAATKSPGVAVKLEICPGDCLPAYQHSAANTPACYRLVARGCYKCIVCTRHSITSSPFSYSACRQKQLASLSFTWLVSAWILLPRY